MKSWQLKKSGSENLHLIESPTPQPAAGQILVRTKAVSLNYRDKLVIEDNYPLPISYPLVPGSDLAGEVVAVGSGVSRFKARYPGTDCDNFARQVRSRHQRVQDGQWIFVFNNELIAIVQ